MARLWPPLVAVVLLRAASHFAVIPALTLLALSADTPAAIAQEGATKSAPRRASAALEETFSFVKKEVKPPPGAPDTVAVAAQGTPEGHWRFVNQAGVMFTAGTADEMKRVVTVLYPEAKAGAPLAIYLTEDTVLGPRSKLRALPPKSRKHLVVDGKSYPLLPLDSEPRYIGVRPYVAIEVSDQRLLKEALVRLDKPLAKARVRLLALQPDASERTLPLEPPAVTGATAAVERIDPAHLADAVAPLGGQTVVVCARGAGDLVYVKPRAEPERSLPVADLMEAAKRADVRLIVLQLTGPLQRPSEAPCPDGGRPAAEVTLADILDAAARGSAESPVALALGGGLKALDAVAVGDLVGATIRFADAHRRSIVSRRLPGDLPFTATALAALYGALLLLGWLGTPVARRFWGMAADPASGHPEAATPRRRGFRLRPHVEPPPMVLSLWSAGEAKDYASRIGYRAACVVSFLVFALVFQPLTGLFTALYNLLPQIWRAIAALVRPVVWLARGWDRFARRSA